MPDSYTDTTPEEREDAQAGIDTDALLRLARQRLDRAVVAENNNRIAAVEDIEFKLGGERQWPEHVRADRENPANPRPMLTFNKLPQFVNQVVNDGRLNRPQIKVSPAEGGDKDVARVLSGLIKHIEYESDADIAYDTALEQAADGGWGFIRVRTDYEDDETLNQRIMIERVRNRFSVYLDPSADRPDGADAKWAFISDMIPREEAEALYPGKDFSRVFDGGEEFDNWRGDEGRAVRITEYIWLKEDSEEKEIGGRKRIVTKRTWMWCKMSGCEVLEKAQPLVGKYLPVVRVIGSETDLMGEVVYSGLIRNAKDPQRQVNYWRTATTEQVALRPLAHHVIAEGQDEGHEEQWATAHKVSYPNLKYKPTSHAGHLVPAPKPIGFPEVPAGALTMAKEATQDLYDTTGIYPASLGQPGKDRSGKAMLAEVREGDVGTFHYIDNLSRALRQVGRIVIAMIPEIYDTERQTRILGEDDSEEIVRFKPNLMENGKRVAKLTLQGPLPDPDDPETLLVKEGQEITYYDPSVGKYDVRVSTGPSFTTKRAEAAEAMLQFAQAAPEAAAVTMDLIAKYSDWPGAEEIAERMKLALPPEIRAQIAQTEAGEGQPDPEQRAEMAEAQVQQMAPQMQQMAQMIEQMQAALMEKQTENQLEVMKMMNDLKRDTIEAEGTVRVAEIQAGAEQAKAQGSAANGTPSGGD